MRLAVSTREQGRWVVVVVDGEVDYGTAEQMSAALVTAGGFSSWLVIDCALLAFSDSSFLATLVTACKQSEADGGVLVVAAAPTRLRRKLEITGLDQLISMYPTVAEAVG